MEPNSSHSCYSYLGRNLRHHESDSLQKQSILLLFLEIRSPRWNVTNRDTKYFESIDQWRTIVTWIETNSSHRDGKLWRPRCTRDRHQMPRFYARIRDTPRKFGALTWLSAMPRHKYGLTTLRLWRGPRQ